MKPSLFMVFFTVWYYQEVVGWGWGRGVGKEGKGWDTY